MSTTAERFKREKPWLRHKRKLDDPVISKRFSLWYRRFRPGFEWFEGYQVCRRLIILAVFFGLARLSDPIGLSVCLWIVSVFFLIVHVICQPYAESVDNHLEAVSLVGLVIIATLFSNSLSTTYKTIPSIVVLVLVCTVLGLRIVYRWWRQIVNFFRKKGFLTNKMLLPPEATADERSNATASTSQLNEPLLLVVQNQGDIEMQEKREAE